MNLAEVFEHVNKINKQRNLLKLVYVFEKECGRDTTHVIPPLVSKLAVVNYYLLLYVPWVCMDILLSD